MKSQNTSSDIECMMKSSLNETKEIYTYSLNSIRHQMATEDNQFVSRSAGSKIRSLIKTKMRSKYTMSKKRGF